MLSGTKVTCHTPYTPLLPLSHSPNGSCLVLEIVCPCQIYKISNKVFKILLRPTKTTFNSRKSLCCDILFPVGQMLWFSQPSGQTKWGQQIIHEGMADGNFIGFVKGKKTYILVAGLQFSALGLYWTLSKTSLLVVVLMFPSNF